MELIKDQTILEVLKHLQQKFGKESFSIEDNWDADLCAIGLADLKGKYLLYLSTYGKKDSTFYVELEERNRNRSIEQTILKLESLTVKELDDMLMQYFFMQPE